jgi:hypothetical protein
MFRKGLSRISKGRKLWNFRPPGNFVQGRKFWPWGGISGPETEFLALQISLLWMISSLSTAVPIPTPLHHRSCAIPEEFLHSSAQD